MASGERPGPVGEGQRRSLRSGDVGLGWTRTDELRCFTLLDIDEAEALSPSQDPRTWQDSESVRHRCQGNNSKFYGLESPAGPEAEPRIAKQCHRNSRTQNRAYVWVTEAKGKAMSWSKLEPLKSGVNSVHLVSWKLWREAHLQPPPSARARREARRSPGRAEQISGAVAWCQELRETGQTSTDLSREAAIALAQPPHPAFFLALPPGVCWHPTCF